MLYLLHHATLKGFLFMALLINHFIRIQYGVQEGRQNNVTCYCGSKLESFPLKYVQLIY